MATKAQKIRVGAFVVVSAALLAIVLVVFGGMRFWERHRTYRIVFASSVMGLEQGAQVYLNGIKVGRVEGIAVAKQDLGKVEVRIAVKNDTPVHTDTKAFLQFAGITGLKVIDLREGTLGAPHLPAGGTIAEGESTLDKLEQQAKDLADESTGLMKRANQIVENLVTITNPARFDGVDEIVEQSRLTANRLASTSATLDAMVKENRSALKQSLGAVHAAESTSSLIDNQVAGLVTGAGQAIDGLRDLVRGNETQIRSAVFDLRQASRNFKEMSREVRQRPSRLLFSSPPSERKLK
jgi:phospholipid/cholesterol/gamma-HCH transport system substrate-binding protein